jgi:C-terminal processing protease CtpA/Prc
VRSHIKRTAAPVLLVVCLLLIPSVFAIGEDVLPPAPIINDEGGTVLITGRVTYTNPFFTLGVSEPVLILEDQAGFIDRNRGFLMAVQSQVLGQITSDFFQSPFTYSITLPQVPQAALRDVDNDGEEDTGVMVYAVAYWDNTFGDPYLEERDLYGGGWSNAYASTRVSTDADNLNEYIGGSVLVFAPDDQQAFPIGFGDDGLLFTEDDPVVALPQGYTVVSMDSEPFTFDRSREIVIDLIEGEASEPDDFSALTYTEAFDAMVEKLRREYAFTEYKGLDWDQIAAEMRPQFEEAERTRNPAAFQSAMMRFTWQIPDGHVFSSAFAADEYLQATDGSVGIAIRELDDGRVIVTYVVAGSPADEAGIRAGAEIQAIGGQAIGDAISAAEPFSQPFSSAHNLRLQQLRYAVRFPLGSEVAVTYRNPAEEDWTDVTLETIDERESWQYSYDTSIAGSGSLDGFELPLEYELLPSGIAYAKIYSFSDNNGLLVDLWERMLQTLNDTGTTALIIDMRQNSGGSGFIADQLAAYFYDQSYDLGNTWYYDKKSGEFTVDPNRSDRFYLPPEQQRYRGEVAVLVSPSCYSACEFFTWNMTLDERAAIVGQYPTGGLGGSVEQFFMPDGVTVQFTVGRAVDAQGNIHLEGVGVVPTVRVPVDESTLFTAGDPVLEAAVAHLGGMIGPEVLSAGDINAGETVRGDIAAGQRLQYTLAAAAGDTFDIVLNGLDDLDTVLRVLTPDQTLIAENDDASDTTLSSALEGWEVSATGIYLIEVATYQDAEAGAFELTIEAAGAADG